MADATLQARINGGSVETGGVVAATGDMVELTAANKMGWGSPPTRWEIYDHPVDFALPAGWTDDGDGIFYYVGSVDPPAWTLTEWGYYSLRLIVGAVVDTRTHIRTPSPLGLLDPGRGEDTHFGGSVKASVAAMQANLRTIEDAIGAVSLPEDPTFGAVTADSVETDSIANSDGTLVITGGTGITLNHGGLAFTVTLTGNVARLVGSGSAGLLLSTAAGAATVNGATGVALQHGGAANFTADLSSNVSRLIGAGSSGTLVQSTSASLTLNAPTNIIIQRAGVTYVTVDATGLTATGLIAPTLQHGANVGILAPSYVYIRSAGGVYLDGPVSFRSADGSVTRASVDGAGALTLPVVAAASVATPAAGSVTYFADSSNSDKLSKKNSAGVVTVVGAET